MKFLRSLLRDSLSYKQRLLINAALNRGEGTRYLVRAILSPRSRAHQTTGKTYYDRYPRIFKEAQGLLSPAARILSFGCATGEEVLTLRKHFPDAVIVGSEIYQERLDICRALLVDKNISFIDASKKSLNDGGPYDAIFCMAVLQRVPHFVMEQNLQNIGGLYPFQKFDEQVTEFDGYLKPGGLIILKYTHYRFCDAAISADYEVVIVDNDEPVNARMFDVHSNIIVDSNYHDVAFRKLH